MLASEVNAGNIDKDIVDRLLFSGLEYDESTADLILVPGSRKAPVYRVPEAVKLFDRKKAPLILLSGGAKISYCGNTVTEAEAMFKAAEKLGVDSSVLLTESSSHSTAENMRLSGEIIEKQLPNCKKIVIVTTAYHMRRALKLAQHELPQYDFVPCPASHGSAQRSNWIKTQKGRRHALDECMKFGYYIKYGYIDDFEI